MSFDRFNPRVRRTNLSILTSSHPDDDMLTDMGTERLILIRVAEPLRDAECSA